jgi:ketosteroid isomerase-like protein
VTVAENAEIARRVCEAVWRRPEPDIETMMALGHRDHEMFPAQSLVEGGGYRGVSGFKRWLASWNEMFGEDWVARVEEVEPVGDEHVLVTSSMKARGAAGGVPIDQRFWVVMTVRDGRATRSEVHTDRAQALAAVGLAD